MKKRISKSKSVKLSLHKRIHHRIKGFLSFSQFLKVLRRSKYKKEYDIKIQKQIKKNPNFIPLEELKEEMQEKLELKRKMHRAKKRKFAKVKGTKAKTKKAATHKVKNNKVKVAKRKIKKLTIQKKAITPKPVSKRIK
ncbi:hypothetical protein COY27_04310 [Candidatus Woesearchaeota archaeon CG_4_10_14_0_2_um_filter_33_13]|nr:MAG: hypothetical protein COY27_04310 [Candidatus Woesearchaeota archaeon CG_4_10_14_0_2_um_filter_33_13]